MNGETVKLGAMGFISGRMETNTKANGLIASSMGMELISLVMATCTKVSTNWASQMALVNTNGAMAVFILVILATVSSMEKANGAKTTFQTVTLTKASTNSIRSMVMVFSVGTVVMCTKETMLKT